MRWIPLLLALPLVACGGGDTSASPNGTAGPGPQGSSSGEPSADPAPLPPLAEPAVGRSVTLQIPSLPLAGTSALAFIGFDPDAVQGNWAGERARPRHHAVTEPVALAKSLTVDVPLHGSLTYFAVLDANGDAVPNDGEGVSGPVTISKDTAAKPAPFVIELLWGAPGSGLGVPPGGADAGADPDGSPEAAPEGVPVTEPTPDPTAGEPVTRALRLDSELQRPVLETARVLVVGLPASGPQPYVGPLSRLPTSVWASENLTLTWPLTLKAQFPPGGDVQILLDLDGDGVPSKGDLASAPMQDFAPVPADSEMDVTLVGYLGTKAKADSKAEALGEPADTGEQLGDVPAKDVQLGEPMPDPG